MESGRREIHVRPFSGPGGRVVVSTDGGRFAQWSRTQNRLFFAAAADVPARILVADYTVQNGQFTPTTPRPWSNRLVLPRRLARNFVLHPDGKRVAAHVAAERAEAPVGRDQLVFVTNLFDELRRLAPRGRQ
jgi:hypothetical protein